MEHVDKVHIHYCTLLQMYSMRMRRIEKVLQEDVSFLTICMVAFDFSSLENE